jgi:hypothetical protein
VARAHVAPAHVQRGDDMVPETDGLLLLQLTRLHRQVRRVATDRDADGAASLPDGLHEPTGLDLGDGWIV